MVGWLLYFPTGKLRHLWNGEPDVGDAIGKGLNGDEGSGDPSGRDGLPAGVGTAKRRKVRRKARNSSLLDCASLSISRRQNDRPPPAAYKATTLRASEDRGLRRSSGWRRGTMAPAGAAILKRALPEEAGAGGLRVRPSKAGGASRRVRPTNCRRRTRPGQAAGSRMDICILMTTPISTSCSAASWRANSSPGSSSVSPVAPVRSVLDLFVV